MYVTLEQTEAHIDTHMEKNKAKLINKVSLIGACYLCYGW